MERPIDTLRDRVIHKKGEKESDTLTHMLEMVREFSCLGEIIGRDFEIRDKKGELVYTVHQKPMAIKQFNQLFKEFVTIKKLDNEREAAKWGKKR